jgi:fumarylacetoacetate (FAA) hydrolase
MKFPIVAAPAGRTGVAIEMADGLLPVSSFRDFYSFERHVKTARAARGLEMVPQWYDFPVFYCSNAASIVGPEAQITCPVHGNWLDYELEVAAVIGSACRDVTPEQADRQIAGYSILNDWSLRDLQREEVKVGLGPAKGKDFATSLGPCLVTPDELEDCRSGKGYDLTMVARLNGVELSRGNWRDIHWSFGEMIARASQGVTLFPGDVIGSGTVGTGCILELGADNVAVKLGRDNGWLQAGDVVELEVERLGVLRNEILSG